MNMNESIWSARSRLPTFPTLEGDVKTDVLIIGGGMAGILCAHMLQNAGVDYILAEAERICGGITKNTTAKISSQHGLIYNTLIRRFGADMAQMYYEANQAALSSYRSLCSGISCGFETRDSYVYTLSHPAKLEREMLALETIGADAQLARTVPLPFPTRGAVMFPNQAQFDPLKFAAHIANGLNIYEHTPVRELKGTTAVTDRGRIRAHKIIVATHFPFINKHGSYFLKLYQHRSYVLAVDNAPDAGGMFVDEAEEGMSFRSHDGLLFIGGGDHRTGKKGGGWTELTGYKNRCYPHSRERYRWATQDCMSLDGVPYIGHYSARTPDLYVATGFNKWGMTSSMTAAMLLCDMVQGRHHPWAELFSPSRSMVRTQLFINAGESALNLVTPTAPRCPHMGCALKWNRQEHSWDCPCHGSRFDEDGALIDNPSTGGLKSDK